MKQALKILILCALALVAQSCRSVGSPELKQLKVSSKWLTPSPDIRPVSGKNKLVYLSIRNTSGSNIEIRNEVRAKVQELGYRVTDDLDQAYFILMADLRYFGEKSDRGYGNTVGGAVIGGVAGGVVGNTAFGNKNRTRNTVIGAAAGAVIGGVAGHFIDNAETVRILDLVVDVRIGEKIAGGIDTKTSRNANRSLNSAVRDGTEAGRASSSTKESSSFTRREDFFYQKARLVCSARKIGLTDDEAEAPLSKRLSRQIGQLLP
jgi:hypothetical protein